MYLFLKKWMKMFLDSSLYLNRYQKLLGYFPGQDLSSIRVWWHPFFSFCVILEANQPIHKRTRVFNSMFGFEDYVCCCFSPMCSCCMCICRNSPEKLPKETWMFWSSLYWSTVAQKRWTPGWVSGYQPTPASLFHVIISPLPYKSFCMC